MKIRNNLIKILFLFFISLSLSSCDINDYLNLKDEIASNIFPNLWDFLIQFLAFIVMVILITIFAYKPIRKYLDARKKAINDIVIDTKKQNEEANKNFEDSKKSILESKINSEEIIENAKKEAKVKKDEIINEANLEAKNIILKAKEDTLKDKEKANKEIKKELTDLALSLSSEIIKREVKKTDNEKIIDDFLNDKK